MIRKLSSTDAEQVKLICERALGHKAELPTVREMIKELTDGGYYLAAAVDDTDTVCGFIEAQKYDLLYGGRGYNVIALAVLPEKQRMGFGRELVKSLEAHAAENGADFIRLNSRIEREDAHAFYSRLGYCCDKVQKRFIKYLK